MEKNEAQRTLDGVHDSRIHYPGMDGVHDALIHYPGRKSQNAVEKAQHDEASRHHPMHRQNPAQTVQHNEASGVGWGPD
jgi:hypothetical protein